MLISSSMPATIWLERIPPRCQSNGDWLRAMHPCWPAHTESSHMRASTGESRQYRERCLIRTALCLQIEEARKSEGERTGKVHEDMARARAELKRLEKELASLQVQALANSDIILTRRLAEPVRRPEHQHATMLCCVCQGNLPHFCLGRLSWSANGEPQVLIVSPVSDDILVRCRRRCQSWSAKRKAAAEGRAKANAVRAKLEVDVADLEEELEKHALTQAGDLNLIVLRCLCP